MHVNDNTPHVMSNMRTEKISDAMQVVSMLPRLRLQIMSQKSVLKPTQYVNSVGKTSRSSEYQIFDLYYQFC